MGKIAVLLILGAALLMGAGLYFAQTRGYYAEVEGPVTLTLVTETGLVTLPADDVRAISSISSPLGFRACFTHALDLGTAPAELGLSPMSAPAPTIAPPWFECFDAGMVDAMLNNGTATAYVAYKNAGFGVDRIVALTDDGQGWAWHQLNDCGERAYDGTPVGEECPAREDFEPLIEGRL